MCGILYIKRLDNKPAQKQLLKRYSKQKHRGDEGFGYIAVKQSGNVSKLERFQFEHEMRAKLTDAKYQHILMHHRYPTSTPNLPEACHPIKVSHPELKFDYYVTHNGVLSNSEDLKPKHETLGYKYSTEIYTQYKARTGMVYHDSAVFNDSEAFAIEFARTLEGKQKKVNAKGTIAYIVLQVTKEGHAEALYYGTNGGNPLTLQKTKEYVCIASEGGQAINDDVCYRLDLATQESVEIPLIKMETQTRKPIKYPERGAWEGAWGLDNASSLVKERRTRFDDKSTLETLTIEELEAEIEEITEQMEGLKEEAQYAIMGGDAEEEDSFKWQIKSLEQRLKALQSAYERKANALA